jgi:FkbM family methyltransferase
VEGATTLDRQLFRVRALLAKTRAMLRHHARSARGRIRTRPTNSDSPPSTLAVDLLFPGGVDADDRKVIDAIIRRHGLTTAGLRRVLGTVDRRNAASAVSIRPSPGDIALVAVGSLVAAVDRADQSVSATIIDSGTWEPHVVATLQRLLHPGDVFVDIGANVGFHTMLAADLVGPTGTVHAFEPNPDNARLIAHSIEVNALTNTSLYPVALSDCTGYTWFGTAIGSNGGFVAPAESDRAPELNPSSTVVPTWRLDDVDLPNVTLIKMDIEGAEPIAIRGARETIRRLKPTILFEFSCAMIEQVSGISGRDHLDMLVSYGYDLALIDKSSGSIMPLPDLDEFFATWGDHYRIEDLLASPTDAAERTSCS